MVVSIFNILELPFYKDEIYRRQIIDKQKLTVTVHGPDSQIYEIRRYIQTKINR
jgi:hypothetical protein